MQTAEVVLDVIRERGGEGLPLTQLYRQMFNQDLYLLAYGNIYSNQGAMTPGASAETADGMSEGKIEQIAELMRCERYRFAPARRVFIPKKNGKLRPRSSGRKSTTSGSCGLSETCSGPGTWKTGNTGKRSAAARRAARYRRSSVTSTWTGSTSSSRGK